MINLSSVVLEFRSTNNYSKLFMSVTDIYNKNKVDGLSILNYFRIKNKEVLNNTIKKNKHLRRTITDMITTANNLDHIQLKEMDYNYMQMISDLNEI